MNGHFDQNTHTLLPKYRPLHISLLRQVTEALWGMQSRNLIHRDVKADNVLVKLVRGVHEVRLTDFAATVTIGKLINDSAGSYPPPEIQQALEQNIHITLSKLSAAEKDKYDALVVKWKTLHLNRAEIKDNQNTYLHKWLPNISLSTEVDAWALGVLICQTMHDLPNLIQMMQWDSFAWEIKVARQTLVDLYLHPEEDLVDQIAVKLLAKQMERISIQEARDLFQDAT